jgi:NAD dependent epimerase/dehydratase
MVMAIHMDEIKNPVLDIMKNSLLGKKVLVTGADGFIGSHLVERLLFEGCHVSVFVYYNSFNSWGWLDAFDDEQKSRLKVFSGDIRDPNGVRSAVDGHEIIFHLAALIAIPFSYHSPDSYIDTNIKGTLNVLQAARHSKCERILVTSTSEVYGTAIYVPIDEKHPRQPQSPYSASKIGADCIAESFYRSFDLPVTIVRPFNTYGPRQSARAVIPTIITQLLSNYTRIRLGDLRPTRDLLYVEDTVDAFVSISKTESLIGEDVNIATGVEISMGALAAEIINQINPVATIQDDPQRLRPENSEVYRLLGSSEKLVRHCGWKPTHTLSNGLSKTIEWFSKPSSIGRYRADLYNL